MSIEKIIWNEKFKEFFNRKEIKDRWGEAFKEFFGVARIWEQGSGSFYINQENDILFIKPSYRPHDLERYWTFAMLYKEQFIVFYSINEGQMLLDESSATLKVEDQRFHIKNIPENLQSFSNDIESNIRKFLAFYSLGYASVTKFVLDIK